MQTLHISLHLRLHFFKQLTNLHFMNEKPKNSQGMTLDKWYNSLPANQQTAIRDAIAERCDISIKTVYNWVRGEQIPKKPYRDIIIDIAKVDINFTHATEMQMQDIGLVK